MESRTPVNLVFLDACRNNPLAENLRRSLVAGRRAVSLGRGLAKVEAAGHDTLIAFSAAPGQEASDGDARNSPFAASLLKHIVRPGLEVSVMLKLVAADVRQATRNAQRPQQLSDMTQAFYFTREDAVAVSAPATKLVTGPVAEQSPTIAPAPAPARPQPPAPSPQADNAGELSAWQSARASNSCEPVRAFLQRYPNGAFADLAKLSEQRLCAPGPVADLPSPRAVESNAAPAKPAALSRAELARNVQLELMRVGCGGTGALKANGEWDAASQGAMRLFNRYAKLKVDVGTPSQEAIDALRARDGRVCPLMCGDGLQAKGDICVAIPDSPPKAKQAAKPAPEPKARRAPSDDASPSKRARRAPSEEAAKVAPDAPRRAQREPESGPPPSGGGPIGPGILFGIGGGLLGLGR
jgi:hypothetical protein